MPCNYDVLGNFSAFPGYWVVESATFAQPPIVAGHNTLIFFFFILRDPCIALVRVLFCFVAATRELTALHVGCCCCTLLLAMSPLLLAFVSSRKLHKKWWTCLQHLRHKCPGSPLLLPLASFGRRTSHGPDGAIDVAFNAASCTLW